MPEPDPYGGWNRRNSYEGLINSIMMGNAPGYTPIKSFSANAQRATSPGQSGGGYRGMTDFSKSPLAMGLADQNTEHNASMSDKKKKDQFKLLQQLLATYGQQNRQWAGKGIDELLADWSMRNELQRAKDQAGAQKDAGLFGLLGTAAKIGLSFIPGVGPAAAASADAAGG